MIEHWHILGAGAMGKLFACKLLRAGLQVTLLQRSSIGSGSHTQVLVEGEQRNEFELPVRSAEHIEPASIEGLLITTKANQAISAFAAVASKAATAAPIILLHNGMGVVEQLTAQYQTANLHSGTTTEGAYLNKNGERVHAGYGSTLIGKAGADAQPTWFDSLAATREGFSWESDIDASLWRKLLINCAINPLTALHLCRNGDLIANPAWRAEVELLCDELAQVSAARGNAKGASCALDWALGVMQSTAANQSSMLQDVLQQRETEIEYITGYFCREAERLGVPCPHNQKLLQEIREIDSSVKKM